MFWPVPSPSATSAVDTVLDKENHTMEELLDEDEIIQECKASNPRLINFFRERTHVEQLLRYIVEECHPDAEKNTFKFAFMACEIIACEVDAILNALVEDEEMMSLLFSFLKPDRSHNPLLAGYFSKVVICLMLKKTVLLMKFLQDHQAIFQHMVELIGLTPIMEILIRLLAADEHLYSSYIDSMKWLGDSNILEMIVDKFRSSNLPEMHANVAETLCTVITCAPPVLSAKIFSPSFVGRLLCHALEDCRPTSVLVCSLTVCISLLDPKKLASTSYRSFHVAHGSVATISAETVNVMLEKLGDLMRLLNASSSVMVLPTTYGTLQPPLGNLRLKIVEFVSVLLTIGNEDAEKGLICSGIVKCVVDLFFDYPFHNFLHNHVECIIRSCLESKRMLLVEHLLVDCDIVHKILVAEKGSTLSGNSNKPTVHADGRLPPRIGSIGHITRISNKLIRLANDVDIIKMHLQENEWAEWYTNLLVKRNSVENIYQWVCGRPSTIDRVDGDDDDFNDKAFDIATFLRDGLNNDDMDEAHLLLEQDEEDGYFADSSEVIFSSLRLGDDHEKSRSFTSPLSRSDESDEVTVGENDNLCEVAGFSQIEGLLRNFNFREKGFDCSEQNCGQLSLKCEVKPPERIEHLETEKGFDCSELNRGQLSLKSEVKPPERIEHLETEKGFDCSELNCGQLLLTSEVKPPERIEHLETEKGFDCSELNCGQLSLKSEVKPPEQIEHLVTEKDFDCSELNCGQLSLPSEVKPPERIEHLRTEKGFDCSELNCGQLSLTSKVKPPERIEHLETSDSSKLDEPPEWCEHRETSDSGNTHHARSTPPVSKGEAEEVASDAGLHQDSGGGAQ